MDLAQTIALSAGLAWASGLRLYLVVFLAGALAQLGYLHLPATLSVLQNRQRRRQLQVAEMRQHAGQEHHQIEAQSAGPGEAGG